MVGAGPTGLVAAALLQRYGVDVRVVDRQPGPYGGPRAVHLDDECMRVLQQLGVDLPTRTAKGLRLLDRDHQVIAEFARGEGRFGWPQANLFHQPDLEDALRKLVDVEHGVEVTSLPEGAWVLGCDGAGSTVRDLLGIGHRDLGFEEQWTVVDGRSDRDLGMWEGVSQVCDGRRAATFMPLTGDRYRWEFRGPVEVPAGVEVEREASYVFRARVAREWRRGQVFLLGDAAHETPPFIGQGLGAGIRDAHNLCWKLAQVLHGGADLLDTYEAERRPHVTSLIRKARTLGWAMTGGQGLAAHVRQPVIRAATRSAVVRDLLDRPTPRVLRGRRPVGELLPQPTRGDDAALGDGWATVSLDDPPWALWLRGEGLAAAVVRPDRVIASVTRLR